jgi:ferritin
MNERIKELAVKAHLSWCMQNSFDQENLQEFAELLILEVLSDADEMMRLADAYLDKGIDIELDLTKEIKNNFGIE